MPSHHTPIPRLPSMALSSRPKPWASAAAIRPLRPHQLLLPSFTEHVRSQLPLQQPLLLSLVWQLHLRRHRRRHNPPSHLRYPHRPRRQSLASKRHLQPRIHLPVNPQTLDRCQPHLF